MSGDGSEALAAALGGRVPEELAGALAEDDLLALASTIERRRSAQAAALAKAAEGSLRFIPRLLRGPVLRMLGG